MVTGKINLAALKHVEMECKGKTGNKVKGLFIPFEANNIFVSDKEKGGRYLDVIAFELKNAQKGSTHMVKQSFSKEIREKMTDEEKNSQPILGNLNIDGGNSQAEANSNVGGDTTYQATDDLPF